MFLMFFFLLICPYAKSSSSSEISKPVSTKGNLFSRTPAKISPNDVIKRLATANEIACVLSCQHDPSCKFSAVEKTSLACLHLNGTTLTDKTSSIQVLLHENVDLKGWKYTKATADVYQSNLVAPQQTQVNGVFLKENGHFIFYWDADPFRKMFLTDNMGEAIKDGYLEKILGEPATWQEDSTWISRGTAGYQISNFNAVLSDPQDGSVIEATADFKQNNIQGIQAGGLQGTLVAGKNFIFHWDDQGNRKMVLTDNAGQMITTGYLSLYVFPETWKQSSTWIVGDIRYSIKNFVGVAK